MISRFTWVLLFSAWAIAAAAQQKSILFLGNSYTQSNNLPQMLSYVAGYAGTAIFVDSYTPGGYTFQQHSKDQISIDKINSRTWDYVVLQEQSQLPAFDDAYVDGAVMPYLTVLDSLIKRRNPCTKTLLYMTWGRKNGDADNCDAYPPVCTYNGMQERLTYNYKRMADRIDASLVPVGQVWSYARAVYPSIELYYTDGSHPEQTGTYLAALSFYSFIYPEKSDSINYDASLSPVTAAHLRNAVKAVVNDSLLFWKQWNIPVPDKPYKIEYERTHVLMNQIQFSVKNYSGEQAKFTWYFGDKDSSISNKPTPTFIYNKTGVYKVRLIIEYGCNKKQILWTDTIRINWSWSVSDLSRDNRIKVYPNPASHQLHIGFEKETRINSIAIYAADGKRMYYSSDPGLMNGRKDIDINDFQNGIYLIELSTEKGRYVARFVKGE